MELLMAFIDANVKAEQQGLMGLKKTQMMYAIGVSHVALVEMEAVLLEKNLIDYDGTYYAVTDDGKLMYILWKYIESKINYTPEGTPPEFKIIQRMVEDANIMGKEVIET